MSATLTISEIAERLHHGRLAPYESYKEWFADLGAATNDGNYSRIVSVLHNGWSYPLPYRLSYPASLNPEYVDRLEVYLAIANDWESHEYFRSPHHRGSGPEEAFNMLRSGRGIERLSASALRQDLARTTFDIVLRQYFAKQETLPDMTDHRHAAFNNTTFLGSREFRIVREFLALRKGRFSGHEIPNLPTAGMIERSPLNRHLATWLLRLPEMIWKWEAPEISSYLDEAEKRERTELIARVTASLPEMRHWMIEVLYVLGELEVLNQWLFELDEACLAQLHEIALRSKLGYTNATQFLISGTRPAQTLEEAMLAGSLAAALLVRRQMGDTAAEALRQVRAAQNAEEEAARRTRELAAAEQAARLAAARLEELRNG